MPLFEVTCWFTIHIVVAVEGSAKEIITFRNYAILAGRVYVKKRIETIFISHKNAQSNQDNKIKRKIEH